LQETNYTINGAASRFLDYGDLSVATAGAQGTITFQGVAHPRRLQALLATRVRAARAEAGQPGLSTPASAATLQLQRIIHGEDAARTCHPSALRSSRTASTPLPRCTGSSRSLGRVGRRPRKIAAGLGRLAPPLEVDRQAAVRDLYIDTLMSLSALAADNPSAEPADQRTSPRHSPDTPQELCRVRSSTKCSPSTRRKDCMSLWQRS